MATRLELDTETAEALADLDPAVLRELRKLQRTQIWQDGIKTLIRAATILGIAYLFFDASKSFAGVVTQTDVNIVAEIAGNFVANKWFAVLLGGSGVTVGTAGTVYGLKERRFRKRERRRLSKRVKALEAKIDPERSSSKLTPTGDTRKGD